MIPTSRAELIAYCKRQSGEPLVRVNIHTDQLNDAIDRAVQFFQERHNEGAERVILKHTLTQAEVDSGRIVLPDSVFSVLQVLNPNGFGQNFSWASYQFELLRGAIYDAARAPSLSNYVITRQYLADIDAMLSPSMQFTYRQSTGELILFDNLKNTWKEGSILVAEIYALVNGNDHQKFWGMRLLRDLAAAYVKYVYATNLIKYGQVQLPSGIVLNGESILATAEREIEKAERAIMDEEEPLGFVVK